MNSINSQLTNINTSVVSDAVTSLIKNCRVMFDNTCKQQVSDIIFNFVMFWISTILLIVFGIISIFLFFNQLKRYQWPSIAVYSLFVGMLVMSIVYIVKLSSSITAFNKNNGPILTVAC